MKTLADVLINIHVLYIGRREECLCRQIRECPEYLGEHEPHRVHLRQKRHTDDAGVCVGVFEVTYSPRPSSATEKEGEEQPAGSGGGRQDKDVGVQSGGN